MAAVLIGLGSKTPSSGWSMAATGGLAGRQEPRDASVIDEFCRGSDMPATADGGGSNLRALLVGLATRRRLTACESEGEPRPERPWAV